MSNKSENTLGSERDWRIALNKILSENDRENPASLSSEVDNLISSNTEFLETIGVLSTGFLFRSSHITVFLPSASSDIARASYQDFYLTGESTKKYTKLIPYLFYLVRQVQRESKTPRENSEEFLVKLSPENGFCHYVTVAEMYLELLKWRYHAVAKVNSRETWRNSWMWSNSLIVDAFPDHEHKELWNEFINVNFTGTSDNYWHSERDVILKGDHSFSRSSLSRHFACSDNDLIDTLEGWLASSSEVNYVTPVLPTPAFYLWSLAFPERPATYAASQVWLSSSGRLSKPDGGHFATVGVALSIVRPASDDPTLPEGWVGSSCEIARVCSFLDLLAMPLVEQNYYQVWWEIMLDKSRRAARAAVFARNFSHITGSHVVSNPEFRHSLVGEDLMRGFRKRLGESHRGFVDAENDLFRFMLEKAYKVEDLWTAGTKVLADAREEMGTGGRLMENTRRFHEYLQGRFDFIARAIDDTQDQPEPLWFVKDLVEGFLSQTAYLDTLVADVGLRREKMEFVVKLPDGKGGSAAFVAEWKPDPRTDALMVNWKNMPGTSGKIGDYATLVALPGGMVSAHAFYSLLENIIRNSAKYGSLKEIRQKNGTVYQMVIELVRGSDDKESPKQHFDLRIWDNYSGTKKKDKDGKWLDDQVKPLQKRLEQDFVKPTGEQTTENLGMMEMQACAQMLYRGEDKGIYPDEQADHVCAVLGIKDEERKRKARQFNLWTDEENEARKVDGHFLLTYHLTLNVPVLLAALTAKTGEGSLSYRTNRLEKVRNNWPHLLILDGTANDEADQWLEDIAKNPEAVPYRTLVLCKDGSADCTNKWKGKIEEKGLKKRVRHLGNKDLYELIFANENSDKEKEKAVILAAYEAWLRAWKGTPTGGQWHLWIGMERPVDQVKEGWETAVRGFNEKPSSIRVSVRSFESGQAKDVLEVRHDDEDYHKATEVGEKAAKEMFQKEKEWDKAETPEKRYWLAERASDAKDKRALVFDNHGNCFPGAYEAEKVTDLEQGTRFYQKLSGTVSPDLFRTLSRPPADEFGFAFFIYSLVESCLTNIAVVDERVAWNLIEGGSGGAKNDHFAEHLAEHQKAGVFPVFRFRQEGAGTESGFYNATHRELVKRCVSQTDVLDSEGVVFNAQIPSDSKIRFLRKTKCNNDSTFESIEASPDLPFAPDSPFAPDVLLIHEGAMDILTSEQGVDWKLQQDGKGADENYLNALYTLAPAIVRTSGRGRKSKLLGEHLPFIEFGEVSSALLTARNKFSLVRGLLGSAGTERKP